MEKVKIAVFVSGGGTNLQAILDASDRGEMPHGEIALVLSSKPDVYALERAKKHGVPAVVANRKELGDRFEAEIERQLAAYGSR